MDICVKSPSSTDTLDEDLKELQEWCAHSPVLGNFVDRIVASSQIKVVMAAFASIATKDRHGRRTQQVFSLASPRVSSIERGKTELEDMFFSKVVGAITVLMRCGGLGAWSVDTHLQEILARIADNELVTGSDDDDINTYKDIDTITITSAYQSLLSTVGTKHTKEEMLQSEGIA